MRSIVFSKRTAKEILRDPLTFIFCLGFPLVMLVIMTIVNESIPPQAAMKIFEMEYLAPGIVVFGLTFIMQFTCLQVSKDRSTAFLSRLYASPMKPIDFIIGYTLPILVIAIMQCVVTFVASLVVAIVSGQSLNVLNLLLAVLVNIPAALLFLGLGMLFGTLLNDKAAPGICSILITVSCLLGGIWMDVDTLGGTIMEVSHILPFYQSVKAARMAVLGQYSEILKPLLITGGYAMVIYIFAVFTLKSKMKKDIS